MDPTNTTFKLSDIDELWSDEKCKEIAFKENFPAQVLNPDMQKVVITRFFNFYLGAKKQKGVNVTDLVFSTIAIMPLDADNDSPMWETIHFSKDGKLFFLNPDDRLKEQPTNIGYHTDLNDIDLVFGTESIKDETETYDQNVFYERTDHDNTFDITDFEQESVTYDDCLSFDDDLSLSMDKDMFENDDFLEEVKPQTHKNKLDKKFQTNKDTKETSEPTESNEMNNLPFPKFADDLLVFSQKRTHPEVQKPKQYGPTENAAFISSCNKLLEQWDKSLKARIVLKYFFGVIALILMRATTKKYKHLIDTFSSSKMLNTIIFSSPYIRYSIPHKRCIRSCYRTFSKRDGNIPVMFAKLVMNSRRIDLIRTINHRINWNIFKVTVLSHTADYGLGIISMLQKIERGNVKLLVKATFCEETAVSWYRIKTFLEKYMKKQSGYTHHWARIIDIRYFNKLSCAQNYALSVILTVFSEKMNGNSDVWKSSWVENEKLEYFKKMAFQMYRRYERLLQDNLPLRYVCE